MENLTCHVPNTDSYAERCRGCLPTHSIELNQSNIQDSRCPGKSGHDEVDEEASHGNQPSLRLIRSRFSYSPCHLRLSPSLE
ncbi:hypothetical protein TNCV_3891651 [Trichonephila clavipes]|nr:hypothetical protein TNCV_3891651 [Trichonephila clavipes]